MNCMSAFGTPSPAPLHHLRRTRAEISLVNNWLFKDAPAGIYSCTTGMKCSGTESLVIFRRRRASTGVGDVCTRFWWRWKQLCVGVIARQQWRLFVEEQTVCVCFVCSAAMGSLMAGWNKKPWNEKQLMNRSKTSLTKEEIEEYWRKRQLAMEEHLTEASAQKEDASQSETGSGTANIDIPKIIVEEEEIQVAMSPDWWTRSNNAFLNSPPERDIMNKHSKYAAQFEVANKANRATSPTT